MLKGKTFTTCANLLTAKTVGMLVVLFCSAREWPFF